MRRASAASAQLPRQKRWTHHCLSRGPWRPSRCSFLDLDAHVNFNSWRAVGYLCQLAGADFKRPLGFLTTSLHLPSRLSLGWPHLESQHGRLQYKGPLHFFCYCGRNHSLLIGITDTYEFQTSTSVALGPKFWDLCVFDHSLETRFHSLRDGGQTDLAPLAAVGIEPLLSVSLASGIGSLRPVYEAWRAGTITKSMLADIPGCDDSCKYFSEACPSLLSLSSSPRSRLCSLWRVTSVPASGCTSQVSSGSGAPPTSSRSCIMSSRARSRTPSSTKRPLVQLRQERCFALGNWRSTWSAKRQVCSVHSVPSV